MSPQLVEGEYVFCTVNGPLTDYLHLDPIAMFREQEGLTGVLRAECAPKGAGLKTNVMARLVDYRRGRFGPRSRRGNRRCC
ncbi:hypothetical protein K6U21_00545, partial [Vibrio vulnificus]|nr:hypothetical protein [Vibrio vulnificus]